MTTKFYKCIISLSDEENKIHEEGKEVFLEKKWPTYIAIVIICIPVLAVLGFAEKFSMAVLLTVMSSLMVIIPVVLAGIIGYMDDVKSFAENFKDPEIGKALTYRENFALRRTIWYPVITGVICGVSSVFTDSLCAAAAMALAVVIAVKVKGFASEYKEMKETLSSGGDDQDNEE